MRLPMSLRAGHVSIMFPAEVLSMKVWLASCEMERHSIHPIEY